MAEGCHIKRKGKEMEKLQIDEYEYLKNEVDRIHEESGRLIREYIAEMESILLSKDVFHTEQVSEKLKQAVEVLKNRLFPELESIFKTTGQKIETLGEQLSEADEDGRRSVQWEE